VAGIRAGSRDESCSTGRGAGPRRQIRFTGWSVARYGSRLVVRISAVFFALGLPWLALAPTPAWLTLALIFGANYVRLTRANMIETMGEDYIRTARAKGLPSRTVTFKHGLRAAITPVVTVFGLDLGALLGGAVLTETIFSVPGLGRTAVNATFNQDLPIVMAVVLFSAFFIIFANIIVDILYAVIDPRVRLN